MSDVIVRASGLTKEFIRGQTKVTALEDVDLAVPRGDFVALMGPSGSGKSTLLHLIAGMDKPTSGVLTVLGEQPATLGERSLARWRNHHIGFVFQSFNLIPVLTALENVAMPLLIRRVPRPEAEAQAAAVLSEVGLAARLSHRPGALSGGERQRAALARALVTRPACVLADEPTGNLDRATADAVFALMLRLSRDHGISFVIVTHDPQLAARTDRQLRLSDGLLAPL